MNQCQIIRCDCMYRYIRKCACNWRGPWDNSCMDSHKETKLIRAGPSWLDKTELWLEGKS